MPKDVKEERLRWVKPIHDKKVRMVDVAELSPYSKRTLERWLKAYREKGEEGLIPKSTRPKTNSRETPIRIKERVVELRKETGLGAKKLAWKLEKEGIGLHYQTVHKIIKKEGLTRKYRTRKIKYKYLRAVPKKGELVEIDIKYVPQRLKSRRFYQFTAIDTASRWRYLKVMNDKSTLSATRFLESLMEKADFKIEAIKTDNDSAFTNRYIGYSKSSDPLNPRLHAFDKLCGEFGITHYLIDPGKPAQNGKVERSHRTDQEMFYDNLKFSSFEELRYKVKLWNMYYNDLEHCGLNGKTPNEMVELLN